MRQSWAAGVACLCLLLVASGGVLGGTSSSTVPDGQAEATVWLGDQASDGTAVSVETATLPAGGFIAVHTTGYSAATNQTYGTTERVAPESVIGVSRYLGPGEHRDVSVRLSEPITGSQPLAAIVYRDVDGDGTFDFATSNGSTDGPYLVPYVRNTTGEAVVSGPAVGGGHVYVGGEGARHRLREHLGLHGGGGDGDVERTPSSAGFWELLAAGGTAAVVLCSRLVRRTL